jgi:ATP-dependent Clp protease ATP-binding subunit ClpC
MNVLPQPEDTHGREMVFTERSKRIIELAFEESRAMRHLDIGGEHLLLALLHEGESPGAKA